MIYYIYKQQRSTIMKIESLMSGWRITEYGELNYPCDDNVCLTQLDRMKPKTVKWILDNYNFNQYRDIDERFATLFKLPKEVIGHNIMMAGLDIDDVKKIAIMENHPDLEKQLIERFGENWARYYLRFNH